MPVPPQPQERVKKETERRIELEEVGDGIKLLSLDFGIWLRLMRQSEGSGGITQKEAARRAGMSRVQWNRLENGHDHPRESSIEKIALAVGSSVAGAFKRASYPIPPEFAVYSMKQALQHVEHALVTSQSMAEFINELQTVWQEFQQLQLGFKQRVYVDPGYSQILAAIQSRFTVSQRLQLAMEIVEPMKPGDAAREGINPQRFIDTIDMLKNLVSKSGPLKPLDEIGDYADEQDG